MVAKTPTKLEASSPTKSIKNCTKEDESPVDPILLNKALQALLKHHTEETQKRFESNNTTPLFEQATPVEVQFSTSRVPGQPSPRPIRIDIPHALRKIPFTSKDDNDDNTMEVDNAEENEAEICLIVKDSSKEWIQELISTFSGKSASLSCVKKVLSLTSLRKKHNTYAARRTLLSRFDLFLADDRILPMLGKALGKTFFEKKKQPIPIKITRKEALPFAIERCLMATFMWISAGTCLTIKAGNTNMPTKHLAENIQAVIKNAATKIPRKWSNISSISIKTSESVALPIYNKTREELEEIAALAKVKAAAVTNTNDVTVLKKKRALEEDAEGKEAKATATAGKMTKKQKLAATKSPLVKALKKQKKNEENNEVAAKEKVAITNEDMKKKKRSTSSQDEKGESKEKKEKEELDVPPMPSRKDLVKKRKQDVNNSATFTSKSEETKITKTEKKDFMASKRFKGSKKGYVFKMGKEGLGYYKDVLPVVNKMAIEAFVNMSSSPRSVGGGAKNRPRRKSVGGKRRGRR